MKTKSILPLIFLLFYSFTIELYSQKVNKPKINDTTYMLTYDHGGLILWGSEHFRERLKNAIEWLDKYPSFKIGLDNEAHIYDYFAEHEPSILEELNGYLKKYRGRFGIGSCTYGQPLSQFINDESNIRQIYYALNAERKHLGYRPLVYLMSEHAMHSQIPQIIKGFGFQGAIMRTHFMMYGYNPVFDVPIGWWVGIDGSRIAAVPTYPGEGAAFGKTTIDTWILTRYPSRESPDPMETFRKKFRHINPLLASRADDSGLRREELVREYEKKPKYSWILLDDLLKKFPSPVTDMVTGPNDFTVRMPWGYCGNEIWNCSREAETAVLTAERLASLEVLYGGISHEADLDLAWKDLLLAQHHDIQICGLLPESRRLLPASLKRSEKVINESMSFFASKPAGNGLRQVTVFNPLSWEQERWIFAEVVSGSPQVKSFMAVAEGTSIPARIITANRNSGGGIYNARIAFKAKLPPLGISSFSIRPADGTVESGKHLIQSDSDNKKIITPFYEIELSGKGGIEQIRNSATGQIIIGGKERGLFFEGTIDGEYHQSSGKWIIERTGEVTPWITLKEYGFISDIPYEFEITFYEDDPRIDCKVKFDFNGQKIGLLSNDLRDSHSPFVHEEKLRFKIFPELDTTAIGIRDLPFAVSETRARYIEGNYWTALSDGKSGVAFFNKGNMGSIREKDRGFSIPLAYSMYYIWGTRTLYGNYNYEFAILPFRGSWREADLHKKALEYAFKVPSIESEPVKGNPVNSIADFKILEGMDNIIMTALYPKDNMIYARFFSFEDKAATVSLNPALRDRTPVETDLDGNVVNNVDGRIIFNPWEIKTFVIHTR